MNNLTTNKRYKHIDVAKGIGVLLVIVGHCLVYKPVVSVIYSFHVPMFFVLSGLFVKTEDNILEYTSKKIKQLIVPYLVFFCIGALLTFIIPSTRSNIGFGRVFKGLIYADASEFAVGPIWFLMCLFVCSVYFYILDKTIFRKNNVLLMAIVLVVLYSLGSNFDVIWETTLGRYIPYWPPFKLDLAIVAVVFYSIGYLLKDYILNCKIKLSLFIVCAISTLFLSWTNGSVAMGNYNDSTLFLLFSLTGTILIVYIADKIKESKLLLFIGKISLIIFVLHAIIMRLYSLCLDKCEIYNNIVASVIKTIVVTIVTVLITFFYKKIKSVILEKKNEK